VGATLPPCLPRVHGSAPEGDAVKVIMNCWLFRALGSVSLDEIESRFLGDNFPSFVWRRKRKLWTPGEVLTTEDLNGEFDRIQREIDRSERISSGALH
jgi:hypothetical protein